MGRQPPREKSGTANQLHFRIAEDARPFAEGEVGRDDDRGALIETADEMEQQLPARLGEGEITEFVEDDEVEAREIIGEPSLAASARLSLRVVGGVEIENDLLGRPLSPEDASANSNTTRDGTGGTLNSPLPRVA